MRIFKPDSVPRAALEPGVVARFLETDCALDLEIGSGAGWHALTRATAYPRRRLIAIERTSAKFGKLEGRFESHDRPVALLPLHADAVSIVTHELPAGRFDNVFLLYPNPEPKNPAQRWIRMPFFARVIELLAPEGLITFATNERFYFDELLELGPRDWPLEIASRRELPPAMVDSARTHFEKKYLARGETCLEVQFRRSRQDAGYGTGIK